MPVLESDHAKGTFTGQKEELESTLDRETLEQAEAATSSHLVRMIDFFFALVLGQGLIRFSSVIEAPFSANPQVWLALVLIYYTVVRSFVAWHAAIETRRYRMLSKQRTTELWRVYIDVVIVAIYAFMLFSAEPLMEAAGSDIAGLLWAFPTLFVLYAIWGAFRRVAWGSDLFQLRVLFFFALLYTLLAAAYTAVPSNTLSVGDSLANIIVLATALVLMGLYRYVNFWQESEGRERWLWSLPRPRLPELGQPD